MNDVKTHRVQVVSVNDNVVIQGKKGPYSGLEFKYVQNGEQKSKAIHNAFFDRSKALIDALKSFKEGDTVELTVEGAPFFGMVSANKLGEGATAPAEAPHAPHKPHTKPTFVDNSVGMQVGNALTNAATLIAGGTKGTLEEVAESILHLGEKLKGRLIDGAYHPEAAYNKEAPKSVPPKKDTKQKAVAAESSDDDDMENPFGD